MVVLFGVGFFVFLSKSRVEGACAVALHVATCVYAWGTALGTLVACRAAPQCCEFVRESLVLFMHVLRLLSCYPRKIRCGFRHTYSTAQPRHFLSAMGFACIVMLLITMSVTGRFFLPFTGTFSIASSVSMPSINLQSALV